MGPKFCLVILCLAVFVPAEAQEDQEDIIMHPGIRNTLLGKGQFETALTAFYGVFYNNSTVPYNIRLERQNQHIAGFTPSIFYGIWKWLNVGAIYQFMYIRENFMDDQTPFTSSYTTNSFGPQVRIKVYGTGNKTEIYIQSNFLVPLDSFIPANKITFTNQLIATRRFGYNWILSAQLSAILLPDYTEQKRPVILPASFFAGFLIQNNLMAFMVVNHTSDFGSVDYTGDNKYYRLNYSTSLGLGVKYRILRQMDVAGYYLHTLHSKNGDKFNNLSVSILKQF